VYLLVSMRRPRPDPLGVVAGAEVEPGPAPVASSGVSDLISPSQVAHVAHLARLQLTDQELARYTEQLASMLDHFRDIDALELDDVEPMSQPLPLKNVFREDVVGPTLDRDEVLAAAPAAEDGLFRVPPILGEAP
jgi:aspartyl-tRNA(Asn)/glutamyl-tRNA(Gln) amidotransferase subunit C